MLNFTNQKGTPIGEAPAPGPNPEYPDLLDTNEADDTAAVKIPGVDNNVEIPGVDGGLQPEHEAPQIEIDDPDIAYAKPPIVNNNPALPVNNDPIIPAPEEPVTPQPVPTKTVPPHNVCCSTRASKPLSQYIPSMEGNKYSYAATQLQDKGLLHPDSHMFVQTDFYQYEPNIVAYIMTQLSLKAGLHEWGDCVYDAAFAEMKQLHMRHTFEPKHCHELTQHQKDMILESHQFIKEKRDKLLKAILLLEVTDNATTSLRKMQVCQPLQSNQ
jgi:hypothetical protein